MCLRKIDNHHTADEGEGYKVYEADKDGELTSICVGDKVVTNIWMKAERKNSPSLVHSDKYDKGFHIYEHLGKIPKWIHRTGNRRIIKKVKYRKVICSGQERIELEVCGMVIDFDSLPVIVAEEMMVLEEITAPPIKENVLVAQKV